MLYPHVVKPEFTQVTLDEDGSYVLVGNGYFIGTEWESTFTLICDSHFRPIALEIKMPEYPKPYKQTWDWDTKETCIIPEDVKNSAIEVK